MLPVKYLLLTLLSLFYFSTYSTFGQLPDTEIYMAEMKYENSKWIFGEAENITSRVGYDNQPSFSPDKKSLLFVQVSDSLQSDVAEYSFKAKSVRLLTSSPESEYSPSYTPDKSKISTVRVDLDSAQRFYTFNPSNPSETTFIPGTDSIGYYCWLNDSLLAMFLVGEKFSLQLLDIRSHLKTFIAFNIGRCLKLSADNKSLLFLDKSDSTKWMISSLRISDFKINSISPAIKGSEDFSPLPDGSLIMGSEGKLFLWNEKVEHNWILAMDYQNSMGPFYRITVNEDGNKIAFVTYAGKKP